MTGGENPKSSGQELGAVCWWQDPFYSNFRKKAICFNLFKLVIGLQNSHAKIVILNPLPPTPTAFIFLSSQVSRVSITVCCDTSRVPASFLTSQAERIIFLPTQAAGSRMQTVIF
jgi:hypothetical protein